MTGVWCYKCNGRGYVVIGWTYTLIDGKKKDKKPTEHAVCKKCSGVGRLREKETA